MKSSHISSTEEHSSNEMVYGISSCRLWLAIEFLCTWRWPGGSAVQSLLPFLCECALKAPGHLQHAMVDAMINILFVGALKKSAGIKTYPLNVWTVSDDEVNKIEEPILRALVMLLAMLFKNGSIWTKADASRVLLDYILSEELLSTSTVNSYVSVAPHVLSVLVPIVRKKTISAGKSTEDLSLEEGKAANIQEAACQWLQRALSGSPLILCQMGQTDVEEWVHVAVSCFPLSPVGGMATLAMASSADISPQERALLLALFQKQASQKAISGYHALAAERRTSLATIANGDITWELRIQLSLARLMAVAIGYCWQGFGENEWVFVLAQLRKWLESVVHQMEELAEGVDYAVKNIDVYTSSEVCATLESVEKAVSRSQLCSMDLAETAIFIFSLLCRLCNLKGAESTSSLDCRKREG